MIIGLIGNIGSGKTTIASILTKQYNYEEIIFSDPLKQIGLIFGFEHHQLYGTQLEKNEINKKRGISGRTFLQKFGTDICRDILPNIFPTFERIWIKLAEEKLINSKSKNIIFSDCRFYDEVELIKKHGGMIVKIVNECNECNSTDRSTSEVHNHSSEILDELYYDIILVNEKKSISVLQMQIDELLKANLNNFKYCVKI